MHLNQWDYVELLFLFHVVKIGDVLEEIGIQVFVLEGVVRLNKVGEFFDNQLVAVFFSTSFATVAMSLAGNGVTPSTIFFSAAKQAVGINIAAISAMINAFFIS